MFNRDRFPALFTVLVVLFHLAIFTCPAQAAATITLVPVSGAPGSDVDVTVRFDPAAGGISMIQFDLLYSDLLSYASHETGDAAKAAAKGVSCSTNSPGRSRFLITGLNMEIIGAGTIAVIRMHIAGGAGAGTYPLGLTEIVATTPDSAAVPVAGIDGSVTVNAPADTTPPVISGVGVSGISGSEATVVWKTNEASSSGVRYGTAQSYGQNASSAGMVTVHSVTLTGLSPATTYHYQVSSADASGNTSSSGDGTFTTDSGPDLTAPAISSAGAWNITPTSATVRWVTDEPANSFVDHGITDAYGATVSDAGFVTSHALNLTGLKAETLYHYRIRSADGRGNEAMSGDLTFTTAKMPEALEISNVQALKVTSRSASISWTTNVPSDTQVEYGTGQSYGTSTSVRSRMVTDHSQSLNGLQAETTYHFRVISTDANGMQAVSGDYSFSTTAAPNNKSKLAYPRVKGSGKDNAVAYREYTGIAVANLSEDDAVLTFTAYNGDGTKVQGLDIDNPVELSLEKGRQLPIIATELFGWGLENQEVNGWIEMDSSVENMAGFTLIFDGDLKVLDGAPVSFAPVKSAVFPEIEESGFTDVHLANPAGARTTVWFDLIDSNGIVQATEKRAVEANGTIAESIRSLFPGVALHASEYLRVRSSQPILPFEMFGRDLQYLEGLNGLDTDGGATTLYSPQYATGGRWRSTLSIVNFDNRQGSLMLRLIGNDGAQVGATRVVPIAPQGKVYISDQAFFVPSSRGLVEGYVEIKSNGIKVAGSVAFSDPEHEVFASALPLVSELSDSIVFSQVASNDQYFTGIALLNPNDAETVATFDLHRSDGTLEATAVRTIPPRQRLSELVSELFPGLAGENRTSGYIRVRTDLGVASFAVFGTGDLQVLSAVPGQEVR